MIQAIIRSCVVITALAVIGCSQQQSDECEALFVQRASAMSFDGKTLTLSGAAPDLVFFCDRPERTAGHLRWDTFMEQVATGENSFAENPPNAAVSVIDDSGNVEEIVVDLHDKPTRTGNTIAFPVKVLDGTLPAAGGMTILFIDPIGHPLSPTSVAGVHRRVRRRAVVGGL